MTKKDDKRKSLPKGTHADEPPGVFAVKKQADGGFVLSRRALLGGLGAGLMAAKASTARAEDGENTDQCGRLMVHQGGVNSVAFNPDGTLLASGS
jgi:hypothetical protein